MAASDDLVIASRLAPGAAGELVQITPERAGWRYVGFEVVRLRQGERLERPGLQAETCIVVLAGCGRATAGGQRWSTVGGRPGPFDGLPHAVYVPVGLGYSFEALTETAELAIGRAPVTGTPAMREPRLITPEQVRVSTRGAGAIERSIHDILMEDQPADTLLVTEVLTPGGHWSSYPPHKHDTHAPPHETALEELYYHRLRRPETGWAVQRVYTADRTLDATLVVRDGDCVLVPRGYHPVSAAPGYDLYYLNVMAGPLRQWRVTFDPAVEAALRAA